MKKIFTLSALVLTSAFVMNGCVKGGYYGSNEDYWLSKERGDVVYSDSYCSYYVVQTSNGYTIIEAYGGYKPAEGSIVYGNFSSRGTRDIYNRTTGFVFTGTITDYWLTYAEAQSALDYYCPVGKAGQRVFKSPSQVQNQ